MKIQLNVTALSTVFQSATGDGMDVVSTFSVKTKMVIEYDEEIPHSQTADKPMASRGRATQQ